MIQVTIHEAKTYLSRLIQQALDGEEAIIARDNIAPDFDAPLHQFESYTP
jgi:antitoxin (DNA-binding transcriptional repressor) of toxin-antitoxin stability system